MSKNAGLPKKGFVFVENNVYLCNPFWEENLL